MLKALAILPLLATPASAYTFVYQCEMGMGGAIVIDDTPDKLSFEITYDFGAPAGRMDGTLGEIEITLNEIDDFIIVTSLEEISGSGAAHTVRIHSSGSATYNLQKLNNPTPTTFQWFGKCENMRPI